MSAQHTPVKWKVLPCPVHAGKHPYHDHRWIATADAQVEYSPHVPNDWTLSSGSLICQMRDVDPAFARLIAAAPDLLEALEDLTGIIAQQMEDNGQADNLDGSPMWTEGDNIALGKARTAIAKAGGAR